MVSRTRGEASPAALVRVESVRDAEREREAWGERAVLSEAR